MTRTKSNSIRNTAARLPRVLLLCALLCALLSVGAYASKSSDCVKDDVLTADANTIAKNLNAMNGGKGFGGNKTYAGGSKCDMEVESAAYDGNKYDSAYYHPKDLDNTNGGKWFYFEYVNNVTCSKDNKDSLWCVVFYTDGSKRVNWTSVCKNINRNTRFALNYDEDPKKFGGKTHYAGVKDEINAFFIQLPATADRIVAVKFIKNGDYSWGADWMRVARAKSNPLNSSLISNSRADKYRSFDGEWIGSWTQSSSGSSMSSALSDKKTYGAVFSLIQNETGKTGGTPARDYYLYEIVTGEKGYRGENGTITLTYIDYMGVRWSHKATLASAYELASPDIGGDGIGVLKALSWNDMDASSMQYAAAAFAHNLYEKSALNTMLLPYTATHLMVTLPKHIQKIESITLDTGNSGMTLQSLRLIERAGSGKVGATFWNGSYSREKLRCFDGRILAQATQSYTLSSAVTLSASSSTSYRKLETFESGKGPTFSTWGSMVGVSMQIADALNAGLDELMAKNCEGENFWTNLDPYVEECLTLELYYKDTFGAKRRVQVPFLTTYICQIVMQDAICKTGCKDVGISLANYGASAIPVLAARNAQKEWISGLLRQNDNVGLALRLSEFGELLSMNLTYGTKPEGFSYTVTTHDGGCDSDYTTDDVRRINTDTDVIAIENICFYKGVNANNFKNSYDASSLGVKFSTSLNPQYSFSAANKNGRRFAKGGTLKLEAGGNLREGKPDARSYPDAYIVRFETANIDQAATSDSVRYSISYTQKDGTARSTGVADMVDASANFYGISYLDAPQNEQYRKHMNSGCVNEFLVELADVKSIDSITLTLAGKDEWQFKSVKISKLNSLEPCYANGRGKGGIVWERRSTSTQIAYANKSVLLYENNTTRTLNFTTFDEKGEAVKPQEEEKNETYIHTLPEELTYNESLKDLGLSVPKYTYTVNVAVADVPDAGSSNYFYFQLCFENGMSGVVLANQQLASDSFRQGMTESFQIKTTQNYGKVVSVRIICDNASSTSNIFDKLNIDKITVTLSGLSGVSRSWIVERVGWIDITYADEGADQILDEFGTIDRDGREKNVEIVKEFEITKTATAVDLLFAVATQKGVSFSSIESLANLVINAGASAPDIPATLVYYDSYGSEKTLEFSLTERIKAYNDTENGAWIYRSNHFDRFILPMTDVSSVQALYLSSGEELTSSWQISSISVQQVVGVGDVYMSTAFGNGGEYYRDVEKAENLAESVNSSALTLGPNAEISFTFTENEIKVNSEEEEVNHWDTSISNVPNTRNDTLNIYIFPGTILGKETAFAANYPGVRATINYSTVYGGSAVSSAFNITKHMALSDGTTVLCGDKLSVTGLATLNSIKLSTLSTNGEQPYIGKVIVERVRDGVMVDTYCLDYGGASLLVGNPETSPTNNALISPMHQTIQMQVAPGQAAALTAESSDILVALRYTSALDATGSTVYRSPYVSLAKAGYSTLSYGRSVTVPFSIGNVGRVVGLSIISSGPSVGFERALVANYDGAEGDDSVLLHSCGVTQAFTSSKMRIDLVSSGASVVPATFTFTTGADETYAGAGAQGKVDMVVWYADGSGARDSVTIENIAAYLPEGEAFTAESTQSVSVLLPDADYITSVLLDAADDWFLTALTAAVEPLDGEVVSVTKSVNNHASADRMMTVDVTPVDRGGTAEGNEIVSFTLNAAASGSGTAASATATRATGMRELTISAYEGDTVTFTPGIKAIGSPDESWTWYGADGLTVNADGSAAVFHVPSGAAANSKFDVGSVRSNGDHRLTIGVTVTVAAKPAPQQPAAGGGGGASAETDESGADAAAEAAESEADGGADAGTDGGAA